ncbi:mandelate racemase/muconate lactonizing enzyme family protein [Achromobacter denitrificans]|uniref:Mandelate racemase/muconate lactonizing enzyme family protein n=1 Tax=Achromobacter denitrificans TaxID=32002 RepID=A0ABZ3FUG1_ACHDE|nr:hypothetical protein EC609_19600 [Achromobacter denitrificans]
MKLQSCEFFTYRLGYRHPVQWSDTREDAAEFLLLRLNSDSEHSGVSEITLKPTWTGASLRSLVAIIQDVFLPLLHTHNISDIRAVRRALDVVPENHAAKTLIDNALWDLYASAAGQSLWNIWQGRPEVELSWAVTRRPPADMAREAAQYVDQYGFRTLKIKGGQGLETDVRAMREIRQAVGDQISLYVDANGYYPVAQAPDYIRAMADMGAYVVEDPCVLVADASFKTLQKTAKVPILVDFSCHSVDDARIYLDSGARAMSLKPGRLGLSNCLTMSELAKDADAVRVVGLFGESSLGTLSALQLASTLHTNALAAEVTWFLAMVEQVIGFKIQICDGKTTLPQVAGMNQLLDYSRMQAVHI